MELQSVLSANLLITSTKMDVKFVQTLYLIAPHVIIAIRAAVVKMVTIFLIIFSVFNVTHPSVIAQSALRMVFVCSVMQIAIWTLL